MYVLFDLNWLISNNWIRLVKKITVIQNGEINFQSLFIWKVAIYFLDYFLVIFIK